VSEQAAFFGGGQHSLRDLAVGLRGGPVEPLVILPSPGPLSEALEAGGVPWVALPLPAIRPWSPVAVLAAAARLAGLARARGLDILHSDAPRAAIYAGIAARLSRRRHVWHLRASRASSALADRLALLLSDRVIAVSRAAARRSRALCASRKVRVVPTGVAPVEFLDRAAARAALGLPADRFIAGVVGRVEPDKGGADAIEALGELRAAEPGALLVFLGPEGAAGGWGQSCRMQAAAAGLGGEVLFVGRRPEAARLLRAFDLLLHPSRHEALPRVLIEALFAGVPAVAAAVGGVPEVIEPGVGGILVPAGDPRALGRAAAGLARDPALRRRLAEAGQRRAQSQFRLEPMLERVLSVYAELRPAAGPRPAAARLEAR
jgi:glycosyltransferase involved in cell wall biosynthesis